MAKEIYLIEIEEWDASSVIMVDTETMTREEIEQAINFEKDDLISNTINTNVELIDEDHALYEYYQDLILSRLNIKGYSLVVRR